MIIDARNDTITLVGRLDKNIWAAIQAAAAVLLQDNPLGIIIDCKQIDIITGEGIKTFADAFKYITQKNARIIFVAPNADIIALARATAGVRSKMPIADTLDGARKSLNIDDYKDKYISGNKQILIPLIKDWKTAISIAHRFYNSKNCDFHLVGIVELPLSMSYSSPMPEVENKVMSDLQKAESILSSNTKSQIHKHIIRARNYFEALSKLADSSSDYRAIVSEKSAYIEKYYDQENFVKFLKNKDYYPIVTNILDDFDYSKTNKILVPYSVEWKRTIKAVSIFFQGKNEIVNIDMPYTVNVQRNIALGECKPLPCYTKIKQDINDYIVRYKNIRVNFFYMPVRTLTEGLDKYIETDKSIGLVISTLRKEDIKSSGLFDFVNNLFLNNKASAILLIPTNKDLEI